MFEEAQMIDITGELRPATCEMEEWLKGNGEVPMDKTEIRGSASGNGDRELSRTS